MAGHDDLFTITDALYQADLAGLQSVTAEESALERALHDLDEEERRAALLSDDGALALRQFGGDLLWKSWIGRKRRMLNEKLANVRVRKDAALRRMQRSFGKKTAASQLEDRLRHDRTRHRALRSLAEEQAQMILQASRTGPFVP